MTINSYINSFLQNDIKLYDNGLISKDRVLKEYKKIKSYFLTHFKEGDIVALYLDKTYLYPVTIIACMEIGLTYIPLRSDFPKERVNQIKNISDFTAIIDDKKLEEIINSNIKIVQDSFEIYDNKPLYIMFTSGSTGAPKGVMIERKSYANYVKFIENYYKHISSEENLLNIIEYSFDVSLLDIALLISKNVNFYISHFKGNIFKLMYELENYNINILSTVPNNFSILLRDEMVKKVNLSSLKYAIVGGDLFSVGLYNKFKRYLNFVNIDNWYGPTEATVYCLVKKIEFKDSEIYNNVVSIGKPIDGMEAIIRDDELLIAGKQLMREYVNNIEKTKEVFVEIDGKVFYKTGDICFKNEDGDYFVKGRKDDTIKVAGYRVSLSDIDYYIKKIDEVEDVTTVSLEDELKGNYLVSFIILKKDIAKDELFKKIKEIMPDYQVPSFIHFIDKFPLNNSEKICKKTLKQKAKELNIF